MESNGYLKVYLKFNFNAKFIKTNRYICDQARKAIFAVLKTSRTLCLDKDLNCNFLSPLSLLLCYMVKKCRVYVTFIL
jgi:hypothetical protein